MKLYNMIMIGASVFIILGTIVFAPSYLWALTLIQIDPALHDPCTFSHPAPAGCLTEAPIASFSWTIKGNKITFDNQSIDNDGEIVTQLWYFGDGTVSNKENPRHRYKQEGTYVVTLMILDNARSVGWKSATVVVSNGTSNGTLRCPGGDGCPDPEQIVQ